MKSVEEKVEDLVKISLKRLKIKYFTKNESINDKIDEALKKAESKSGGKGGNRPDIKLYLQYDIHRKIPIMIEIKGTKGKLAKVKDGEIENRDKNREPIYKNIRDYAVNGAVHYAEALLRFEACTECIAIGVNSYVADNKNEDNEVEKHLEFECYYISNENRQIPIKLKNKKDFSFLKKDYYKQLIDEIDYIGITQDELVKKQQELEIEIETKLLKLNQDMHDVMNIEVGKRVNLISGMIMAALKTDDLLPLSVDELKGNISQNNSDGAKIINQINGFLEKKSLPDIKKDQILTSFKSTFLYNDLSKIEKNETESKMKKIYRVVKEDIMPIFTSNSHIDFTGKLFNVLNEWVDVPDGDKNDVVLTPRYVCNLMARLCKVDMNSFVWDYTAGSGGFLVSAMQLMVKDAKDKLESKSPKEYKKKLESIRKRQLLGIEKLPDMYMLAVLNMILMQDGSANILHDDSLHFDGKYRYGDMEGKKFPANVFLLNPPYSAPGKGFNFVKIALDKMQKGGLAAILIQENAGSGMGLPYTKEILEKNTLKASIHMPDKLFIGDSNVQAAIYIFEVGISHDVKKLVKFIDFTNDGYQRQNRKKSNQNVNLRDVDNAKERYDELVKLVLYGKGKNDENIKYLNKECYIEDYITLEGNDWTFAQHKKVDTIPTIDDFKKTVADYLAFKVSQVIKEGESQKKA
ncbi:MAG: N-6 DNA methylase [Lachnospiraceae bacterium]|nr:N-6 DNA methylase [Lachnospiraceae bacterium]